MNKFFQLPQHAWDYGSPTHYFGLDHSTPQSGWTFWAATLQSKKCPQRLEWFPGRSLNRQHKVFGYHQYDMAIGQCLESHIRLEWFQADSSCQTRPRFRKHSGVLSDIRNTASLSHYCKIPSHYWTMALIIFANIKSHLAGHWQ